MTTNFFVDKIYDFKILLSWRFLQKQHLDDFPLCPPKSPPPPSKTEIFIVIVVSPSLSILEYRGQKRYHKETV